MQDAKLAAEAALQEARDELVDAMVCSPPAAHGSAPPFMWASFALLCALQGQQQGNLQLDELHIQLQSSRTQIETLTHEAAMP